jgi:AcrR family transcriptional regulator
MTAAAPSARDRLLAAALQRFARDGALVATLDDVRADAGVSVGALYHHFADKAALAGALYVETLRGFQADFLEALDAHPGAEDGIRAGVAVTLSWCARHPAEAQLLFGGRASADPAALREANRPFFARVTSWYAAHAHYGVVRELDVALVSALWLGPTLDHLRHRLAEGDGTVGPRAAEVLADAAWRALRQEP